MKDILSKSINVCLSKYWVVLPSPSLYASCPEALYTDSIENTNRKKMIIQIPLSPLKILLKLNFILKASYSKFELGSSVFIVFE